MFIGGAVVQWLRDGLGLIRSSDEVEPLAASVEDSHGVYFVPAFAGLGAPHWDAYARGAIVGLTRGVTGAHLARAALESIAFQVADVVSAMEADSGLKVDELRVDGGASRNGLLLQFQADLLGVPVVRAAVTETTALGAAYLAGLAAGVWATREQLRLQWKAERRFEPQMSRDEALARRRQWGAGGGTRPRLGGVAVNRAEMLGRLRDERRDWDLLIIGGGATGVACALDAASRGYRTALVEQHDFGKGTSSRSTKLIHGGVRYLEQGNVTRVMEALKERGILRENAPHLVNDLAFIVPNYEWWEAPFYGVGLRLYDLLAGQVRLRPLPAAQPRGDARAAAEPEAGGAARRRRLLRRSVRRRAPAHPHGAHRRRAGRGAGQLLPRGGLRQGRPRAGVRRGRPGRRKRRGIELRARAVINATGCFSDAVRRMADPQARPMIAPSQGVHLVFDAGFLRGDAAILAPRTRDGRVMFAIPWHGHALVGTTDTALEQVSLEPAPMEEEIGLILETAADYLQRAPSRADILSAWAGIRPLVRSVEGASTASLSRDHSIHIDPNGLITIAGGKWTTCRKMAEDCIDQAALLAGLEERPCVTRRLRIHGYHYQAGQFGHLSVYGSDAIAIREMIRLHPERGRPLSPALPYLEAEAVWAVRWEMARRVEDVLERRTRALQLNARAAMEAAPRVAEILAAELGRGADWQRQETEAFRRLAARYLPAGV